MFLHLSLAYNFLLNKNYHCINQNFYDIQNKQVRSGKSIQHAKKILLAQIMLLKHICNSCKMQKVLMHNTKKKCQGSPGDYTKQKNLVSFTR